jgi:Mrp family chromosome partitioning ATPase
MSDALVLAQKVDGVIFVARSGEVERDILKEVLERFAKLETKLLGIILNDVRPQESRYYYKYSYYYYEEEGKTGKKKRRIKSVSPPVLPPRES